MAKKKKKQKLEPEELWEGDSPIIQGMGLFPESVSLTQNIGCASGSQKKKVK